MGYTHLAACDREELVVFLLSHASRLPVLPSGANRPADHDGRIKRKVGIGLLTYSLGSDLGRVAHPPSTNPVFLYLSPRPSPDSPACTPCRLMNGSSWHRRVDPVQQMVVAFGTGTPADLEFNEATAGSSFTVSLTEPHNATNSDCPRRRLKGRRGFLITRLGPFQYRQMCSVLGVGAVCRRHSVSFNQSPWWRKKPCSPRRTPLGRRCNLYLRNVLVPTSPVRTMIRMVGV